MKILWTEDALGELYSILAQVSKYAGRKTADKYQGEFEKIISLLSDNPRMGKIGSVRNTRELYPINGKYRVVYTISEGNNTLEIVGIMLSKRKYP